MSKQNSILVYILILVAIQAHDVVAKEKRSTRVISGYVLTHEHPTYGMAFGGNYAFAGAKGNYKNGIMEKGYTAYCGGCKVLGKCDHGEMKGSFTAAIGPFGVDMGDHSSHMGPLHNSNSHLRYSTEWIKEAYAPTETEFQDTNMKIMVAYAVENEAMCEQLYYVNKGNGGAGDNGYACSKGDSIESLERQINSIKAWVKENSKWMQIAYSASQARDIVISNKLAIILGVESEYAFGAEDRTFDPVIRLNRYYEQGVRTFYLAHKINSRLSGADIYLSRNDNAGKAIRVTQAISGCFYYDDNVGQFPLKGRLGKKLCDNNCGANAFKGGKITDKCSFKFSDISEANFADYTFTRGAGAFNGFNMYPRPPGFSGKAGSEMVKGVERNNLGLSHDGERVVREAMLKGMMVNIDHISSISRKEIYELATTQFDNYPLNAFHNNPNEMLEGKNKPHEYEFDNQELDYVKRTKGFFGVRLGPLDSKLYPGSGVSINCPNTSTETAQILAWLLDRGINVGYSLDYATVTKGVFSRTFEGCNFDLGEDRIHKYGPYDVQGLSHIGMMKKWHKELEAIGLKKKYLDKLRNNGVEQFLKMWETSEAKASSGKQIPRKIFTSNTGDKENCEEDSDCALNKYCQKGLVGVKNSCKAKKAHAEVCAKSNQCSSGRCSGLRCADADECSNNLDCTNNQFCGDPILGKRSCIALKSRGELCIKALQCVSGRCSSLRCVDTDECQSNTDCGENNYCGDPILGKRKCNKLLSKGKSCAKKMQCASGKCFAFSCK